MSDTSNPPAAAPEAKAPVPVSGDRELAALTGSKNVIELESPVAQAKGSIRLGLAIFVVFFLGFGGWSVWAEYATAVVAQGQVVVEGSRQTVQHLEGGIVKNILVKEGDVVQANQLLIQLDNTRAQAQYDLVNDELNSLITEEARLNAERLNADAVTYPPEIQSQRETSKIKGLIEAEESVFSARRTYLEGQEKIAEQRVLQLQETIKANDEQIRFFKEQRGTIEKEIASVRALVAKGLEREPRLLALLRAAADIDRQMSEVQGISAGSLQQVGQIQASLADVQNQMLSETVKRLTDVQTNIIDRRNRLAAAEDQLNRTKITAPASGIILGLKFHTPGGVIPPGQPIMDIVPTDRRLIVQTQINPQDIDQVIPPMKAEVRLVAYSQRYTPSVDGQLVDISADAIQDPNGQRPPYYLGRVEVDSGEMARLHDVELKPGMPTQVMIRTGETTLAQAIIQPIADSLHAAFRESTITPTLPEGAVHDRTHAPAQAPAPAPAQP